MNTSIRPVRATQRNRNSDWFVSANNKKKFVDFVVLLMQIDRRVTRLRRKTASDAAKAKTDRSSRQEQAKKARLRRSASSGFASQKSKQKKARDTIFLDIQGRRPCFLKQIFYSNATAYRNKIKKARKEYGFLIFYKMRAYEAT